MNRHSSRLLIGLAVWASLAACAAEDRPAVTPATLAADLDWKRMKTHVDVLADDAMAGRIPGSVGHDAARAYLVAEVEEIGLEPFGDAGGYLQTFPQSGRSSRFQLTADGEVVTNVCETGYNIVGVVRGSDPVLADEYIVLMGHYDHLGVNADGDAFNGAFDNASGAALLLEMARVLRARDAAPKRTVVFLWTDGEESGLTGADHWIMNAPVPREQIVVGVSVDPVGRGVLTDFGPLVLMGLERSPELQAVFREATGRVESPVGFLHRGIIIGFASDQDTFHRAGVPGVWVVNPGMSFYHTVDDAPETIDYRVMEAAARYLMRAVFAVGDAPGPFPYRDAPALEMSDVVDARSLLAGVVGSAEITAAERETAQGYLDTIDAAIAADSMDALGDDPMGYFLPVLLYTAFQLPAAHPGPVPPPTP